MIYHPGREIGQRLEELGLTQKALSLKIGKKVSEINELIKGKRNITLAWDYLLAEVFTTPKKYWIYKQIEFDYDKMLAAMDEQHKSGEIANVETSKESEWDNFELKKVPISNHENWHKLTDRSLEQVKDNIDLSYKEMDNGAEKSLIFLNF